MAQGWYPIIDADLCVNDEDCLNFCTHEVFTPGDEHPVVVNHANCVEFCRGCQKLCPADAISYFGDTD